MPNVKKIGSDFEKQTCARLAMQGYWVHFIAPDARGAQPFDIVAVKDGNAIAIDCKTCVANVFNISRLEQNQILAFEKWLACGNSDPIVMVLHNDKTYEISYSELKEKQKIKLEV